MGKGAGLTRIAAATLAQLAGIAAITTGCYLIHPAVGWVVGGLLLVALGVALDPPKRLPKMGDR